MRLKGKILIFLFVVMLVPIILISFFFVIIIRSKFNYDTTLGPLKQREIDKIENSVKLAAKALDKTYQEIEDYMDFNLKKIPDTDYLEKTEEKLRSKYTYLFLLKGKEILYAKNDEVLSELRETFYSFSDDRDRVSEYYLKEKSQYLIKGFASKPGHELYRVFLVSDISEIDKNSKKAISEVFYSMVFSIFISGILLATWIDKTLIKPIYQLKDMTRRIVNGDLDTEFRARGSDEVNELCNDFDDVRCHIKSLLEKNMETEKAIRELVANITHDLRTPLTAIKGYAMGLRDGIAYTPEKQKKYLDTIVIKADDIDFLLDELSAAAKFEMKCEPYRFSRIKLNDYLEEIVQAELPEFEMQNFELLYTGYIDKDVYIDIVPNQFNKVMSNIFSNAKKYRKVDITGILHIKTFDMGGEIRIDFCDNGKGIKKEDLSRVFERFYRVDGHSDTKRAGSGLGLAIAKKIIENHKGRIEISSEYGVGTTVSIFMKRYDRSYRIKEDLIHE